MKHLRYTSLLFSAICLLFTACGTMSTPTSPPVTLKVFAAASLTASFREIKSQYEATHPGVTISYDFDGSQILENQLANGATADIFASADQLHMQKASDSGLVGTSQIFAKNKLIVIIPRDNPAKIYTLKDLANQGVKIDVADSTVPAGKYGLQVLDNLSKFATYGPTYENSVKANFVSQETNVEAIVQKVQLGEVDAGIVYQTDVTPATASKLSVINIPDNFNVLAQYPIAVTKHTTNANEAQAFIQYILSPDGQAILTKYHFIPVNK